MTTQLRKGNLVGGFVGSGDEISYSFGLGKVKLAVEKGALGKLARVGETGTLLDKEVEETVKNETGAVAREFHTVFASVRVRGREESDKSLVEDGRGSILRRRIVSRGRGGRGDGCGENFGEDGGTGRSVRRDTARYTTGDGESKRTTKADDANGTARRSGYGADSICQKEKLKVKDEIIKFCQ